MKSGSIFSRGFQDAGHVLIRRSRPDLVNFLKAAQGHFSGQIVRGGLVAAQMRLGRHTQSAGLIGGLKVHAIFTGMGHFIEIIGPGRNAVLFY